MGTRGDGGLGRQIVDSLLKHFPFFLSQRSSILPSQPVQLFSPTPLASEAMLKKVRFGLEASFEVAKRPTVKTIRAIIPS